MKYLKFDEKIIPIDNINYVDICYLKHGTTSYDVVITYLNGHAVYLPNNTMELAKETFNRIGEALNAE